jgi:uncharacterized protein (DUF2235 family)
MFSRKHRGGKMDKVMAKNLVVCLDGTNNEFGEKNTNVVRLFQCLVRDESRQHIFYDPGVGTMGHPGAISGTMQKLTQILGMAFGLGVTQNVSDAYLFLMRDYSPGDSIYIFGFSRGALEARALAGLLHRCGLLWPNLENMVPYAIRVFRTPNNFKITAEFKATFCREARTRFLGLWDTVTSFGNVWSPIRWPNVTNNPDVQTVRHAMALDERRAFFRQNRWGLGSKLLGQDLRERWFLGVHCDVGGGYEPGQSALWTIPLDWMAKEAEAAGLLINRTTLQNFISEVRNACADPDGVTSLLHDSMPGLGPLWYLAEFVPRRRWCGKNADGADNYEWMWPVAHWFWPWLIGKGKMGRARSIGRPRELQNGEGLHRSVIQRFVADPSYRPDSLVRLQLTQEEAREFLDSGDESMRVGKPP